uniref:Uncharacterized protein n=1 Tax=Papilio xuthus TaxID=66420 RepID=I4DKJ8_PAPXU|nr:unknown unsecreted protein [Papilio xuthus]
MKCLYLRPQLFVWTATLNNFWRVLWNFWTLMIRAMTSNFCLYVLIKSFCTTFYLCIL